MNVLFVLTCLLGKAELNITGYVIEFGHSGDIKDRLPENFSESLAALNKELHCTRHGPKLASASRTRLF